MTIYTVGWMIFGGLLFFYIQFRRGQNSIRTEEDVEEFIKTLTDALASGKISKMSKLHKADLFSKLGLAKLKLQAELDKQDRPLTLGGGPSASRP
jgi:hypothetical protein